MPSYRLLILLMAHGGISMTRAATISFPDDSPPSTSGQQQQVEQVEQTALKECRDSQGGAGVCVSVSSRLCALYPTAAHLLVARPAVCQFIVHDPIICCPARGAVSASDRPTPSATTQQPAVGVRPTAPANPPFSEPLRGCGVAQPETLLLDVGGEYHPQQTALSGRLVAVARHPWTALVGLLVAAEGSTVEWICGGALVSQRVLVTAADCAVLGGSPERLLVRLGEYDLGTRSDGDTEDRRVIAMERHPQFKPPSQRHNLAVLVLDSPVRLSPRVNTICLPEPNQSSPTFEGSDIAMPSFDLTAALTVTDSSSARPGMLTVPRSQVTSPEVCTALLDQIPHGQLIFPDGASDDTELCLQRIDSECAADSGAPLVARSAEDPEWTLVGLQLLGGCRPGQPELALKIHSYVPYIRQAMTRLLN